MFCPHGDGLSCYLCETCGCNFGVDPLDALPITSMSCPRCNNHKIMQLNKRLIGSHYKEYETLEEYCRIMLGINIDDYIEGYEYYGNKIKKVRGWVDGIGMSVEGYFRFKIQADDNWKGARGTIIHSELGEVRKLEKPLSQSILGIKYRKE